MTKKNGIQTFSSKSLNTEKITLFDGLDIYIIRLPEIWSESQINEYLEGYQVTLDRDFIFYQRRLNTYYIRFKNLAGEFSFCGSATLALAQKIFEEKLITEEIIHFRTKNNKFINSRRINEQAALELSLSKNEKIGEHLFLTKTNAIIHQHVENSLDSIELDKVKEKAETLTQHPGAYCACYIDHQTINLRYFSPWYGRDEDFATLSIFEHLGELLQEDINYRVIQNKKFCFSVYRRKNMVLIAP